MKRRHLLSALAVTPAVLAQSAASPAGEFADAWLKSYAGHWLNERGYTLAVLDAMPADEFDFRPNPEQRVFGDQLRHLAHVNVVYFNVFRLEPVSSPPLAIDTKALDYLASPTDREAVRKFVEASFDYGSAVLGKLTEAHLLRRDFRIRTPHTGADVLMRAFTHTAHHRGQAVAYLRARGIAPPAWVFEPA